MTSTQRIPLFPLSQALMPDGMLHLNIFEVRYLDLIKRCHRESTPFGVVGLAKGHEVQVPDEIPKLHRVGTLANIQTLEAVQPALVQVVCKGSLRFEVLTPEREVAIVSAYSRLLEEVWPPTDPQSDEASTVALISGHGALNFAAALSVSALLRLKGIAHRLLPQDAIEPGRFPEDKAAGAQIVCLCYLVSPSNAKYSYLERRIAAQLPGARILGLAWVEAEGARTMMEPQHAATLLPAPAPKVEKGARKELSPAG